MSKSRLKRLSAQLADEPREKLIEIIERIETERDAALLKLDTGRAEEQAMCEPDQIDMMEEHELRGELRSALSKLDAANKLLAKRDIEVQNLMDRLDRLPFRDK